MEILIENRTSEQPDVNSLDSERTAEAKGPLSELSKTIDKNLEIKSYKTPSYTMRAVKKYQEKNREKLNEKKKERYANDPEFRENEKKKALERYYKRRQRELLASKNTST